MKWGSKAGKTRKGKPLVSGFLRRLPMSYLDWSQRVDGRTRADARRQAAEDLATTAAAIVWGLAIGAGVAFVLWYCMQPLGG